MIFVHLRALSLLWLKTRTSKRGFIEATAARAWAPLPVPQMRTRIGSVMVSLVSFPAAGKRREKERRELISLNTTAFLSLLSYIFLPTRFLMQKILRALGPYDRLLD